MKTTVLVIMLASVTVVTAPVMALTPAHFWSHRFGDTLDQIGYSVATDGSGNIYMVGAFQGTVNFGGASLTASGLYTDIFLAKFNASGVHQWSKSFGGSGNDVGTRVATDGSGNVIVTGYFNGTVSFGGTSLVSAGGSDIFLAKFDANGTHQWSQRFGASGADAGQGIATDGAGNIVMTGYFTGIVNFGGVTTLFGPGGNDIFLVKYNASGVNQWTLGFGSTGSDVGTSVAIDGAGNVVVTGAFNGTVNFGGGDVVSTDMGDIFLAKYAANGVYQWSRRFGGTDEDAGRGVAVDGSGSVIMTGLCSYAVDLGGGLLQPGGGRDAVIAKYDPAGAHQWSRRFGGLYDQSGNSVAVDGFGGVALVGQFIGTINLGGDDLASSDQFDTDIFLAKYSSDGVHQWSQRFGSSLTDLGNSAATDGLGRIVTTGYFSGTVTFGGDALTSAGGVDVFLARFSGVAVEPIVIAITDIGNDQGRRVKIIFTRSGADDGECAMPVVRYDCYRRNDALPAAMMAGASDRDLQSVAWLFAGSAPAHGDNEYGMVVPTLADSSVSLGQYFSTFYIRAATTLPATYYDSPSDSGYSLDNLAPGVPGSFAYNAGVLNWNKSSAEDFDYFSVYGASANSFAAATLVDYTVAPTLNVGTSPHVFYFVTATDFSGNEGRPAVVNTLTGVGGAPKSYVLSISSYPNPFNPTTTIRYTVPSKGRVMVEVFDARGSRVTALVDDEREAGAYTQTWNGRDAAGRVVSSGVYFARVSHPAGVKSYKMVLLK